MSQFHAMTVALDAVEQAMQSPARREAMATITVTVRDDDANVEFELEVDYTRVGRRGIIETVELIDGVIFVGDQGIKFDAIKQLESNDRFTAGNILRERFEWKIQEQVDADIELDDCYGAETEAERRWEAATGR